ncbi:uncharacterized protein [Dermacentor andersoni]|uniref:uncharacterized protein isoform X2 n=1 Tax=Dermacentor andersoni TaxID=34620 RepID=UPI0021550295|nr:neurofilament heavy polypeptide-like isoform X2 [Dermacentor andersoni]
MGGVVSKVFGRGYRTSEPGSPNVPADADGAPGEAGSRAAAAPAAATEAASAAKQQGKPEAAAHGKGAAEEAKAQQPVSPTKGQAEPSAPTSDATKPADQQSSKKPTVLDTAKEDVLGVLESVKKNVGAAKEAFFEKPTKTEESKSPSSPPKTTAGSAEQAEPTKTPGAKTPEAKTPESKTPGSRTPESRTPESKTPGSRTPESKTPEAKGGSFLTKLGITKSEEAKQKAKEEAASKPADGEKKESGAFLPEVGKPALETAQGQAERPKSAAEKEVTAQTPPSVTGAGTAEAEAGKDNAPGPLDAGKVNPQEFLIFGKAAAGGLKQKTQEASEAAEQVKQAADVALQKASELKDAAVKAASEGKEKVASLAQQAQKSAAGATDSVAKKGEEADAISQKSQEAASVAKSKAEELKESAADAGKDAAAATAAGAEGVKKASQEAAASATDKVVSETEKAKQTLRSEAEKVEPALKQASESAKERAEQATAALKSGAESMKEKSEQAASAVRETTKSASESAAIAVKAVPELLKDTAQEVHDKGKAKIDSLLEQGKQEEPATASSSPAEQKLSESIASGKTQSESASQQTKPPLPEEPRQSEAKPLDSAVTKHMVYTAIVDVNAAAAGESALSAKTVTMKSGSEVKDGTAELHFSDPVKDGPQETVESPKAVSQEVLDSAKSEAELLVERVISSVVGASESLKHSADDAAHTEKDRLEKLKEKAQQEFALCQEKAHHLLSDVTSAVSTAATSVAAKSAEIYDATKNKAHDLSEQVTAKASDTAESLKHGMHALQEHAAELPQLILHTSKSHGPSGEATTGGSVSEAPHEQAPLLQADPQQERPGERRGLANDGERERDGAVGGANGKR